MVSNISEQVQSFIRIYINKLIKEDFKDIDDISIENLDVNIPRHAIRLICTHTDNDSILVTIVRLLIYGFFVYFPNYQDNQYTIPYIWLHENYDFIPQIIFKFKDDPATRINPKKPLEAEISIRLSFIDITQSSSKIEIEKIAQRIKINFNRFRFTKGKFKYSYLDKTNKINMSCFTDSEADAIDLFQAILDCIQIIFDNDKMSFHKSEKNFNISDKRYVFGRLYEIERRRSGIVEFNKAELHITGIKPILLAKRSNSGITIPNDISDIIQTFYA